MRTALSASSLHDFYKHVVLRQFGLKDEKIVWERSNVLGPNEEAHYFHTSNVSYVLLFEDYGGLATERSYIEANIELSGKGFEYVNPISATDHNPSWSLKPDAPYQHCHNITGTFTLIKVG